MPRSSIRQRLQAGAPTAGFTRWILLPILGILLIAATAAFPLAQRRRSDAQMTQLTQLTQFASEHYQFFYNAEDHGQEQVQKFGEERERLWRQMTARLEAQPPAEKIQFYLYSTFEQKRGRGNGRGEFNADPGKAAVAAVWNETFPRVEPLPDAQVLVQQVWGSPAHAFLGLTAAAYAAGTWRAKPIEQWGPQITFEEGPYALDYLANAESGGSREGNFLSPLVRRPLAGEFARWIISRWGLGTFRELYSTAQSPLVRSMALSLDVSPQELETAWRRWLTEQAKSYSPEPRAAASQQPFFQRGVSFTQEGRRRGGGYDSSGVGDVLSSLQQLGVDSIALVPFSFMPGPDVPELIRFSGESDAGINNTTFQARRLGMKVMLKPQIWLRGGLFPGDVHLQNKRERDLWFFRYRQWILHNARLAEWNGSDLFCIGNELREMTRYETEWRDLIATVRRIYHGPITYGAHWENEFEKLPFWDAVDYIGLNNYFPLTRNGDASATALQKGADDVLRRVERLQRRWGRPVLLTEVGFPSKRGGVTEPWNERVSSIVDVEEQARAYEAIFRSFYDKPWFYGMYWWKWYSTGSGGGPEDGRFIPRNKPAGAVMSRWYRKPVSQSSSIEKQ